MLLVPDPHARLAAVELRGRFVDGEGRPLPSHGVDYAVGGTERLRPLLRELRAALGPLAVESARAECHPGQYEIVLRHRRRLRRRHAPAAHRSCDGRRTQGQRGLSGGAGDGAG